MTRPTVTAMCFEIKTAADVVMYCSAHSEESKVVVADVLEGEIVYTRKDVVTALQS